MHISYKNRLLWKIKVAPPPYRNYLQPLYLSVTLYACAQRDSGVFHASYKDDGFVVCKDLCHKTEVDISLVRVVKSFIVITLHTVNYIVHVHLHVFGDSFDCYLLPINECLGIQHTCRLGFSLLVDQRVPEGTCSQVLRSTLVDS